MYYIFLWQRQWSPGEFAFIVDDWGGSLIVMAVAYVFMWCAVLAWRRAWHRDQPADAESVPPVWQRRGVQVWTAVLVVGIVLKLVF